MPLPSEQERFFHQDCRTWPAIWRKLLVAKETKCLRSFVALPNDCDQSPGEKLAVLELSDFCK